MRATITLHLGSALNAALRRGTARGAAETPEITALRRVLSDYGLKPVPLSADGEAPSVGGIWHAECPVAVAEEVTAKFSRLTGVDGAYVKPAEGPAGAA